MATRSLLVVTLVVLVTLACCASVVSACQADGSVSTGQGGSGGALLANGGWSTNTGQCIDAKDNFARCNNNGIRASACMGNELCCHKMYVRTLANAYTPVKQYAAGVCFLEKDRDTGTFPQGKCVKDRRKECDMVGRYLDFTDVAKYFPQFNCPGSNGCCEYLTGEFDAENKRKADAYAAKQAAQKVINDKAAADAAAAAAAQKASAAAAAAANLAASLAAAKARPVKSIVKCNFWDTNGNHVGSCVQDTVECPGAVASPAKLQLNHNVCTSTKSGVQHCCQSDARFPGVEDAEAARRIVAEKMVADDKAKRAAAAVIAARDSGFASNSDASAPIFAKNPKPIACVGFPKNVETKGTCAISADFCVGESATWGNIQDLSLTCGKYQNIVKSLNDPVCCFGTVRTAAASVVSDFVAADAAIKAARTGCKFSNEYENDLAKKIVAGYCAPSFRLCPDARIFGMAQNGDIQQKACASFGEEAACCKNDPETPSADLATTVCPMPSYTAPTSFLEIGNEVDAEADMDAETETEAELDAEIDAELDAESDMEIDAEDDSSPIGRTARAARFLQRTTAPKKATAATKLTAAAAKKPATAASKKVDTKASTKGKAPAKAVSAAAKKAHCAAERRAWLAGKAKKGDQKAINELMRMGKGKAPKGKKVAAQAKKAPAKKAAAAKKATTAKKARFAQLQPL